MEGHAQSVEDSLIDSLSFKLRPGASYVTSRRSVSFFPQGGNDYKPNGVKVIKIGLNGDQWLDPSTVKLFFTIQNTHATLPLKPKLPVPWVFFRRVRVLCGGQIVEDIDDYNRVHTQFHLMRPTERRLNDFAEAFGTDLTTSLTMTRESIDTSQTVAADSSRTVCFTPFLGLFRQEKFLPVRYAPIQLEFEVVNAATDAVYPATNSSGQTTFSEAFVIQDVQLKCDLVDLDNTLDNEYTQYLMTGKSLPIHYTAITHSSQIFTNMKNDVHVSRSLTRLKSVFVSLFEKLNIGEAAYGVCNSFWHPMEATFNFDKEVEIQIQIGSKLYPEYPIRSLAEAYYQLRKTIGLHFGNEAMAIHSKSYMSRSFIAAIDLEKVLGAAFTGTNTMDGQLMIIRMKPANASTITLDTAANTYYIFYTLIYDAVLQINLAGVTVLE